MRGQFYNANLERPEGLAAETAATVPRDPKVLRPKPRSVLKLCCFPDILGTLPFAWRGFQFPGLRFETDSVFRCVGSFRDRCCGLQKLSGPSLDR